MTTLLEYEVSIWHPGATMAPTTLQCGRALFKVEVFTWTSAPADTQTHRPDHLLRLLGMMNFLKLKTELEIEIKNIKSRLFVNNLFKH